MKKLTNNKANVQWKILCLLLFDIKYIAQVGEIKHTHIIHSGGNTGQKVQEWNGDGKQIHQNKWTHK